MKGCLWRPSGSEAVPSSASRKAGTFRQASTIIRVFLLAESILQCWKIQWSRRKNITLALLSSNFFKSLLLQIRLIYLQFWKESFFTDTHPHDFFLFWYYKENTGKEGDNLRTKAQIGRHDIEKRSYLPPKLQLWNLLQKKLHHSQPIQVNGQITVENWERNF